MNYRTEDVLYARRIEWLRRSGQPVRHPGGSLVERCAGGPWVLEEDVPVSEQPMPKPGRQDVSPVARQRFLETFDAQDGVGLETYHRPLQTFNGRDFGRDAREELVDLLKYITGLEMERDDLLAATVRLRTQNYAHHAHIAYLENEAPPGHPDHVRCGGCPDAARRVPREGGS